MLTDMIIMAVWEPEKIERRLMRMKKKELVDIIMQEAKNYKFKVKD